MEENSITPNPSMGNAMPKRSVNAWMIVAIIFILASIGLGVYGFITIRNQNNKINSLNSQVADLQNTKKTLEDAVAAAAKSATSQNVNNTLGTSDEALIAQAKNKILARIGNKVANVTIVDRNGDFARVAYSASDQPGRGSSMTFKKVNGTWQFIYEGQLNPCTDLIEIFGVPEAWIDKTCSVTPIGAYTN